MTTFSIMEVKEILTINSFMNVVETMDIEPLLLEVFLYEHYEEGKSSEHNLNKLINFLKICYSNY